MNSFLSAIVIGLIVVATTAQAAQNQLFQDQQPSSSKSAAPRSDLAEAEQLNAQVVKLYSEGKYDQALPMAEQVVAVTEKAFGANHVLVADALRNLAEIHLAKKNHVQAKSHFQRMIRIYEDALKVPDPRLISAMERYICLLINMSETAEAIDLERRLYRLENNFDFDDSAILPDRNNDSVLKGGLMYGRAERPIPIPTYPAAAKRKRSSGAVVVKITVDEHGGVIKVKTLCGPPLLVKESEQAAWSARFAPTVVANKPVQATGIIIYMFYGP